MTGGRMRVVRLDENGNPTGPAMTAPFVEISITPATSFDEDDRCLVLQERSFTVALDATSLDWEALAIVLGDVPWSDPLARY